MQKSFMWNWEWDSRLNITLCSAFFLKEIICKHVWKHTVLIGQKAHKILDIKNRKINKNKQMKLQQKSSWPWWQKPLIPAPQALADLWDPGQPALQSAFHDSQKCYTEKPPVLKIQKRRKKNKENMLQCFHKSHIKTHAKGTCNWGT